MRIIAHRVLFLLLFLLALLSPARAGAPPYPLKASLFNLLSIIQANYNEAVDNWSLVSGAVEEMKKTTTGSGLKFKVGETEILVRYQDEDPVRISREEVEGNAFQMVESLTRLCDFVALRTELGPEEVLEWAAKGFVSVLDSHSSYITPPEYQAMRAKNQGIFAGIGVELIIRDKELTVVSPFESTPAQEAGIRANDRIIAINGEPTASLSLQGAVEKIRGPSGSPVRLTILRQGWNRTREIMVTRRVTLLHSVKGRELASGYLFIKVISFLASTADDIRDFLHHAAHQQPIKGVVLDLRNNPGGLLEQSIDVADLFLDHGVIVSCSGEAAGQDMLFVAHRQRTPYTFPLVLLVNEGSASGTEIVAAALRDNDRALLVGTRTFGKGTIQTIFPVSNGAALRLTTAEFFTPNGKRIEEIGLWPDLILEQGHRFPADNRTTVPRGIPVVRLNTAQAAELEQVMLELLQCSAGAENQLECVHRLGRRP